MLCSLAALSFVSTLSCSVFHMTEAGNNRNNNVDISGERLQPSGENSVFSFSGLSFENYIRKSRDVIAAGRIDLGGQNRTMVIAGNAPFELKPSNTCSPGATKSRGILLTHGLTDSPYIMRSLGDVFRRKCFRVKSVLLPGHGTRPGDLLEVKWQEWVRAETFGVDALAAEVDEIYLAGFSTGASLALYQSLNDSRIKGLFLFSPAIKITSLARFANWHKLYSWAFPAAKWMSIAPDEDPFKYESFPFNAAYQIYLLTEENRALLAGRKVSIPVFIAASEDDSTVNASSTIEFFKQAAHPANRMVLYTANPGNYTPGQGIEAMQSRIPGDRIVSSAHTAIIIPPEDPHYGADGEYVSCAHYFGEDDEKYIRCKAKKEDYIGEVTKENLKKGTVRRLTYNPGYNLLLRSITEFIDSLE